MKGNWVNSESQPPSVMFKEMKIMANSIESRFGSIPISNFKFPVEECVVRLCNSKYNGKFKRLLMI